MPVPTLQDVLSIAPQLVVAFFGILVLLMDAFNPRISKRLLANVAVLGLVAAGVVTVMQFPKGEVAPSMQGMVLADGFTTFFNVIFVIGAALSIWLSVGYLEREKINVGEYYALILFTTVGAMVMTASINLICIFIGLEILSIALYILAGFKTESMESDESAMKYLLLGAFASAFFLYGIALVYGATNQVNVLEIAKYFSNTTDTGLQHGSNYLLLGGIALLIVGFGFKVAVVPFHIWTPDVYEGAPTSVTAFMSVLAKAAGFAAFLRVLASGFTDPSVQLQISAVLASIAALTMLVGNVVAVVQPNIKRMLAYSSIAHAGYILAGMVAAVRPAGFGFTSPAQADAISAVLFYMLAYTVSNLGAFGVILALRKRGQELTTISDYAGVGSKYPVLAGLMTLFLLSLAGLPPLPGFFGKLFIINALVNMNVPLVWLIVLFVLTSAVSFYYYLGVVRAMYFDRPEGEGAEPPVLVADGQLKLALGLSAVGLIALGLWSGGALGIAQEVATAMLPGNPFAALR